MEQDNRGMTLIELVIAVTVAVIIMGAATLFIRNALQSYNTSMSTIDLQMESQVLMEQLGGWIMEGNLVKTATDGTGEVLIIFSIPRKVDSSKIPTGETAPDGLATKRIIWQQNGQLYMKSVKEETSDTQADGTNIFYRWSGAEFNAQMSTIRTTDSVAANCIADYVADFQPTENIDTQDNAETVSVYLKMEEGTQSYELNDVIKVRNQLDIKNELDRS